MVVDPDKYRAISAPDTASSRFMLDAVGVRCPQINRVETAPRKFELRHEAIRYKLHAINDA
jgi:hypothetical protein